MDIPLRTLAGALAMGAAASMALNTATADEAEREQICAEARKRYAAITDIKRPAKGAAVVLMYKYNFCPRRLTVKAGAKVVWINVDKRTSHSVWFKAAGGKESDRLFSGERYSATFSKPGTYPYLCGPHWKDEDMKGGITVTP